MSDVGLCAFAARKAIQMGLYAFERKEILPLSPIQEKKLRADRTASAFFDAQAPRYRRTAVHWVDSAKREETRERRLAQLIADCAAGRFIGPLARGRSPR